jgi:hypothetical protein
MALCNFALLPTESKITLYKKGLFFMRENQSGTEASPVRAREENYEVLLPCAPEDFGEFVSRLLGKPQTIERLIYGVFEIKKEDVINTYHLVEQRIHQQNEAVLVQFSV